MKRWLGWHRFTGVTVTSPDAALTVGNTDPDSGPGQAISQRWDGTDWTFTSPHPHPGGGIIVTSVDSLSETDAWAVGRRPGGRALAEHWDGHRWRLVPTGDVGLFEGIDLIDVAMVETDNVWAVGERVYCECPPAPVLMHWDGTTWTRLPELFKEGFLGSISAVSPDDIWVTAGYREMWHWDGATWSQFTLPIDGYLRVSAASTNDVWVGSNLSGRGFAHWDGQGWTYVDSPELGAHHGRVWDITALSKKDAWAVGNTYTDDINGNPDRSVIEHWDGHKWTIVPCPHSQDAYDMLTAVDASSPDDVWAIGIHGVNPLWPRGHRFMLHWDGTSWTRYHHT